VTQWRFRWHLGLHPHPLPSSTAIRCRSLRCGKAIRNSSPWCARDRPGTLSSMAAWLLFGQAGRASGPSTAALSAATASSFTGDLRAARCVARHAGSMLSGASPSRSTLPFLFATRGRRRRLWARSLPTAEEPIRCLRPGQAEHRSKNEGERSKNEGEGGAGAARPRPAKRGRLPRRDQPPLRRLARRPTLKVRPTRSLRPRSD
jgi:hypothetical protein